MDVTSGRRRRLERDQRHIEFKHAPPWRLTYAERPPGEVVRALAWLDVQTLRASLSSNFRCTAGE